MKKFITGFVVAGLLFGGATLNANVASPKFDIAKIISDGKELDIKKNKRAITYLNVAYIPSNLLPDLGFKPSRSKDGTTVYLETTGREYYPVNARTGSEKDYVISSYQISQSASASLTVAHDSQTLIKGADKQNYANYIYANFKSDAQGLGQKTDISFKTEEKFRLFKAKANLIADKDGKLPSGSFAISVYTKEPGGQSKLYQKYALTAKNATTSIAVPLRYVDEVLVTFSGDGENVGDVMLADPIFIK